MLGHVTRYQKSLTTTLINAPDCCQFFLGCEKSYYPSRPGMDDIFTAQRICHQEGKRFYVHCPYPFNLAGSEATREKTINGINSIIESIHTLPACAVLHVGTGDNIHLVADGLKQIRYQVDRPILLLENAAGSGKSLGRDFDELRYLFNQVPQVGLCLDTQHSFASRMCGFGSCDEIIWWFQTAFEVCKHGVKLIHLNDSKVNFGAMLDRHESLGLGKIWGSQIETLQYLYRCCIDNEIDMIIETHTPIDDVEYMKSIVTKNLTSD